MKDIANDKKMYALYWKGVMRMPLKKGQIPESFKQGKLKGKGFESRTKEEMQEIARKSAEVRKKKRLEKMALQKCLKELLVLEVPTDEKKKKLLETLGYEETDHISNQTMLMISLFKKGLSGDVFAIKEIVEMMDKLDISGETEKTRENNSVININIHPVESKQRTKEQDEKTKKEIFRAEQGMSLFEEDWE